MTLAVRAASLSGSAAFLGLAIIAALTMSYTVVRELPPIDPGPSVTIVTPEPPPPPPLEDPIVRQAPLEPTAPFVLPSLPPLIDTSAPRVETTQPVMSGPVSIERPRWLERPRDLARYYPRRAIPREVEGEVLLDCLVTTVGALDCAVLSETPQNWGFGEAALRIARDHRMAPATRDGRPVEGRYRMRVPFELE
jgi:protein TonB